MLPSCLRSPTPVAFTGLCAAAVLAAGVAVADQRQPAHPVLIRLIDEVEVPARATGAIAEAMVREGAVVRRGQLLARIDVAEAELEHQRAKYEHQLAEKQARDDVGLRSAEKQYTFAAADFGRLQQAIAAQPRSVSQSELEKARLEMEQAALERERAQQQLQEAALREKLAESQLALAERQVEIRNIVAPLSGVVVSVLRKPGEWVAPGDKILRIVRTDRLRAEGFLHSDEVPLNFEGAAVTLIPENDSGRVGFPAIVTFVSPEIDPVNGQVRILAEVDNPERRLRPGMRMRMVIASTGAEPSATP